MESFIKQKLLVAYEKVYTFAPSIMCMCICAPPLCVCVWFLCICILYLKLKGRQATVMIFSSVIPVY